MAEIRNKKPSNSKLKNIPTSIEHLKDLILLNAKFTSKVCLFVLILDEIEHIEGSLPT